MLLAASAVLPICPARAPFVDHGVKANNARAGCHDRARAGLRRDKLILGPDSKRTKSFIVVMCLWVCGHFSHKGVNARSALATLNDCIGSFTTWRVEEVCQQRGGGDCDIGAVIRVCSHHHWLAYCEKRSFQLRGLVLPVVIFHVLVVFLQTRQELRI